LPPKMKCGAIVCHPAGTNSHSTENLHDFVSAPLQWRSGELCKNDVKVNLQRQPFQVLVALLSRPGELVTGDELRQPLRPADTFVDFDHSLSAAIKGLRDSLGEFAGVAGHIDRRLREQNYLWVFDGVPERPASPPPTDHLSLSGTRRCFRNGAGTLVFRPVPLLPVAALAVFERL